MVLKFCSASLIAKLNLKRSRSAGHFRFPFFAARTRFQSWIITFCLFLLIALSFHNFCFKANGEASSKNYKYVEFGDSNVFLRRIEAASDDSSSFSTQYILNNNGQRVEKDARDNGVNIDDNEEDKHELLIEAYIAFFLCSFLSAAALQWLISHITVYNIPVSIIWFIFGMILDIAAVLNSDTVSPSTSNFSLKTGIACIGKMNAEIVYLIFLPILLYDACLHIDYHKFKKFAYSGISLAVFGVGYQVAVVGFLVQITFGDSAKNQWSNAFLFASAMASTDPVAVISVLNGLQAPGKLASMFEGESLINDGSSMLLFQFFKSLSRGDVETWKAILEKFVLLLFLGPIWGFVCGCLVYIWVKRFRRFSDMQVLTLISGAYAVYFIGEKYLHTSGPIAIVCYGLFYIAFGHIGLDNETQEQHHHSVKALASLANSSVFIIAGVVAARMIIEAVTADNGLDAELVWNIPVLYLYLLIARATMVTLFLPVLKRTGYGVNWKEVVLLVWGGLRGAIVLAMGLMIEQDHRILSITRYRAVLYIAGNAFLILLVNGVTFELIFKLLNPYPPKPFRRVYLERVMKMIDHQYSVEKKVLEDHWLFRGTGILECSNRAVPVLGWRRMNSRGNIDFKLPSLSVAFSDLPKCDHWIPPAATPPIVSFLQDGYNVTKKPTDPNNIYCDAALGSTTTVGGRRGNTETSFIMSPSKTPGHVMTPQDRSLAADLPGLVDDAEQRAHDAAVSVFGLRDPREGGGKFDAKYYLRLLEHVTEPIPEGTSSAETGGGATDDHSTPQDPSTTVFSPLQSYECDLNQYSNFPGLFPSSTQKITSQSQNTTGNSLTPSASRHGRHNDIVNGDNNDKRQPEVTRHDTDETIIFSEVQEEISLENHLRHHHLYPARSLTRPLGHLFRNQRSQPMVFAHETEPSDTSASPVAPQSFNVPLPPPTQSSDVAYSSLDPGLSQQNGSSIRCRRGSRYINTTTVMNGGHSTQDSNHFDPYFTSAPNHGAAPTSFDDIPPTKKPAPTNHSNSDSSDKRYDQLAFSITPPPLPYSNHVHHHRDDHQRGRSLDFVLRIASEPFDSSRLDVARMTRLRRPEWDSRYLHPGMSGQRTSVSAFHQRPRLSDHGMLLHHHQQQDSPNNNNNNNNNRFEPTDDDYPEIVVPYQNFNDQFTVSMDNLGTRDKRRVFPSRTVGNFNENTTTNGISNVTITTSTSGHSGFAPSAGLLPTTMPRVVTFDDGESSASGSASRQSKRGRKTIRRASHHIPITVRARLRKHFVAGKRTHRSHQNNNEIAISDEKQEVSHVTNNTIATSIQSNNKKTRFAVPNWTFKPSPPIFVREKDNHGIKMPNRVVSAPNGQLDMGRLGFTNDTDELDSIGSSEEYLEIPETPKRGSRGPQPIALVKVLRKEREGELYIMAFNAIRQMYQRLYEQRFIGGAAMLFLNAVLDVSTDFAIGKLKKNPIKAWSDVLETITNVDSTQNEEVPVTITDEMTGFEFEWKALVCRLRCVNRGKNTSCIMRRFREYPWLEAAITFQSAVVDLQLVAAFVDVHEELLWKGGHSLEELLGQKLLSSYKRQVYEAKRIILFVRESYPQSFPYALAVHASTLLVNLKQMLIEEQAQKGLILQEDCASLLQLFEEQHQTLASFRPFRWTWSWLWCAPLWKRTRNKLNSEVWKDIRCQKDTEDEHQGIKTNLSSKPSSSTVGEVGSQQQQQQEDQLKKI